MVRGFVLVVLVGWVSCMLVGCGSKDSGRKRPSFSAQEEKIKKETDPEHRAQLMMKLAIDKAKAKDTLGAEETLSDASKTIPEVKDPTVQVKLYSDLADAYTQIGRKSDAGRIARLAHEAASKVQDPEPKARALALAGQAQAAAGNAAAAGESLKAAEEAVGKVEDPFTKAEILCVAAAGFQKMNQPAEVDRAINAAMEVAKAVPEENRRADIISTIAVHLQEMKSPKAEATFDEAIETAKKTENFNSRAHALMGIAKKLAKAGLRAKVMPTLKEAEAVAGKIPEPDLNRMGLEQVRKMMDDFNRSGKFSGE